MREARRFFRKRLPYACCESMSDGRIWKLATKEETAKLWTVLHGLEIKRKDKNKHQNSSEESREVKNNGTGVNCALSKVNQIISMCALHVKV